MKRSTHAQPAAHVDRALLWFAILDPKEQRETILRLVDRGYPDHTIAALTHLDLNAVRRILRASP